jgi:tetratricopeptide (TPR) repeat protein
LDEGLRRTLNQVQASELDGGESTPFLITKAELCRGLGKPAEQRQFLERALATLQSNAAEQDLLHYSDMLALVQAGLERKPEALEAARQAAELRPIRKSHYHGAVTSSLLTEVYITLGEYDLALAHIEPLLQNPSYLSVNWLKADPLFAPLHDDPRFQSLMDDVGTDGKSATE